LPRHPTDARCVVRLVERFEPRQLALNEVREHFDRRRDGQFFAGLLAREMSLGRVRANCRKPFLCVLERIRMRDCAQVSCNAVGADVLRDPRRIGGLERTEVDLERVSWMVIELINVRRHHPVGKICAAAGALRRSASRPAALGTKNACCLLYTE